jgi:MOSC domain-containing protein YiiM
MATVVSIHKVKRKGAPAIELQSVNFAPNVGMEGDYRSRKGRGRQVTLIEEEALSHVATALDLDTIPSGASRRQIVIRGLGIDGLNDTYGKKLRVGPLLILVHDRCDPCANMERAIGKGAREAMEGCGGMCGKVLEGGTLSVGDEVRLEPL